MPPELREVEAIDLAALAEELLGALREFTFLRVDHLQGRPEGGLAVVLAFALLRARGLADFDRRRDGVAVARITAAGREASSS